tara:strand:+ start:189 stop:401 length:213 start_codon:yes stop_codon:yes gene_type:complete
MVRKLMIRIDQMLKKLRELEKEIENFQDNCNHEQQFIKFDKKNNARWFCKKCDKNTRIPTPKELEEWISR